MPISVTIFLHGLQILGHFTLPREDQGSTEKRGRNWKDLTSSTVINNLGVHALYFELFHRIDVFPIQTLIITAITQCHVDGNQRAWATCDSCRAFTTKGKTK